MLMKNILFLLFILSGCSLPRDYSNVVKIKNVCSSVVDIFIPVHVYGSRISHDYYVHLPVNESGVLLYFFTGGYGHGFEYEQSFTQHKDEDGNFDYPFTVSSSGKEKTFGKNDLIRLSRDVSTKDDKRSGRARYIIDSKEICP